MNYNLDEYDIIELFYSEYYDNEVAEILTAAKERRIREWDRINQNKAQNLWNKFMEFGFVPEKLYNTLDDIAEIICKNVARLRANTKLAGHSPHDPKEIIEERMGEDFEFTQEDYDFMYSSFYDETTKNDFISDFGLKPLEEVAYKIMASKTPEERIVNCDKAFNVMHMRGDLASMFIIGGRNALDEIFGKELVQEKMITKFKDFIK